MKIDPHIVVTGIEAADRVRTRVNEEIAKLEKVYPEITACRVTVGRPQKRHKNGDLYTASVHLTLSNGREVNANRNPPKDHAHEDVFVTIRDTFQAARRQLKDHAQKLRRERKKPVGPPEATVGTLIAEENYGFLETEDGREIYFHGNSVINDGFDKLSVGDRVVFAESLGDKGPQASTVRPLH
ncbi:MAG: HPF/RaiA family ribosome-associated protein [Acidimicrobiales bacterium]|nr:HPF/RaiA family ribosome-associated protein [Hyphomonadaceae bacterium]RZV38049.1 MAG: HPF/RaiA family ribosome-associated protein [Acidimicrobiales bacterium]